MNARLLTLIATCIALPAFAQQPAPAPVTARPNPFDGTSAETQVKLKQLEIKRLDAAIATESLVEEKAVQERKRLATGRTTTGPDFGAPQAASLSAPTAATKPRTPVKAAPAPVADIVQPVAPRPPRLVGTVATPAGWIAIVEANGRVVNIPDGETVDGLRATDVSRDLATINGAPMKLGRVTARVARAESVIAPVPAGSLPPPVISQPAPAAPADAISLGAPAPAR